MAKWCDFKEIKTKVSIESVLEHYGLINTFTKKGDNLVGKCPIHKGTNPTQFHASLAKNNFNCFGDCHGGGNVIDFVSKMEGVDIRQAGLLIQDWFGIKAKRPGKEKDEKPSVLATQESGIEGGEVKQEGTAVAKLAKEKGDSGLILVEGVFDCMKVWQAGYKNVVALFGSSLSDEQEELIIKAVGANGKVYLMFDEDNAGHGCRSDVLERLSKNVFVRVIELGQEGMQPDKLSSEILLLSHFESFDGPGPTYPDSLVKCSVNGPGGIGLPYDSICLENVCF